MVWFVPRFELVAAYGHRVNSDAEIVDRDVRTSVSDDCDDASQLFFVAAGLTPLHLAGVDARHLFVFLSHLHTRGSVC